MGGTDDPSNIVELTIEEHAEAHRKLFEEHGRWEDELAWKGLAGMITQEELVKRKLSEAGKKGNQILHTKYDSKAWSELQKRKWKNTTEEQREQHRQSVSKGRTGIKL